MMIETPAPERTDDPAEARRLLRRNGAAVLSGCGTTASQAPAVATAVFGAEVLQVPEAAEVRDGGVGDTNRAGIDHTVALNAHTDGFAYGDLYPDHFLLVCAADSAEGGESFLVDGYAVLDELADVAETAWVTDALASIAVDQTEPGKQPSNSPVVLTAPDGSRMLRRFPFQEPARDSTDPERDREMIERWRQAVVNATAGAERFKLAPGDAVIVDNYRMLHGREPYADLRRQMWRVWCWTDRCLGEPAGLLHSDSRNADATA